MGRFVKVGLGVSAVVVLAACSSGGGDDEGAFGNSDIRLIVPTSAGGGFDTTARQLQPYLADEWGTDVTVENVLGARTAVGVQASLSAKQDCTTVVFEGVPHFQFSYLGQDVPYDGSDMVPLGGISDEPAVLRVLNDAPWQTLNEFVDDAKSRPGEISVSISSLTSNNNLALARLEQETGADFNVVAYDGGGPSRTGLVAGEVDSTHAGVFNSLSIDEDTRVLAVQSDENLYPELTDDAPTVNDALGVELPPSASNYGLLVPAGCEEDFSERYDTLVEGLSAALENEEYQATLEELGELEKLAPLTPDEYQAVQDETAADVAEVLEGQPGLLGEDE